MTVFLTQAASLRAESAWLGGVQDQADAQVYRPAQQVGPSSSSSGSVPA